ncbi:PREDICTED: uncharacterized protein LOC104820759 [Tarenaya hassleriana]|uniref:uncharacterized protein LOC104820759 n=1 Tax=Tarenaya hassleriana TaxID=28532 RepID=UPI00053C8F16|nr:PREDICTED: uncharacterized protein LOC104820759 [Tarenaya hassleriana]
MATASKSPDSSSNMDIVIERNPPKSRLSELGITSWPKWGCPPGKYALRYEARQTCYLLRGKVKVYPKGSPEFVEFGAGDLVTIPKGLSCTWDVSVSIDKHYKFDSPSSP